MNTVRLFICEILAAIKKAQTKEQKVLLLKQNDCQPLRQFMYANFAENVKFVLPKDPTPFKPSLAPVGMADTNLFKEARKLYLYIENSSAKLTQIKREAMWISTLEQLAKEEAAVLESVKIKNFEKDYSVTRDVVEAAYPGLLPPCVNPGPKVVVEKIVETEAPVQQSALARKLAAKAARTGKSVEQLRAKRNEYMRKYQAKKTAEKAALKAAAAGSTVQQVTYEQALEIVNGGPNPEKIE